MKVLENKSYIEKLYMLLGISIFVHYIFVIIFSLLILIEIFFSKEYKKILKDKSLIVIETILFCSVIMGFYYENYYSIIAIPLLLCIAVGRYYSLEMNSQFKNNNLELIAKFSSFAIIPRLIEFFVMSYKTTRKIINFSLEYRSGYWFDHNPNYLGSIMMMISIVNLYFYFSKKSKQNLIIFFINIFTMILSGSRSAFGGILLGIFVLLFYFWEKKYFYLSLFLLIFYIFGVFFLSFPFLRKETLVEYFWLRVDIIKMAFKIFEKTNFLYGHGNFYYYKFTNHVYPHSHNAIIESMLSYGLIGTVGLGVVFLKYIYEILKNDKKHILKLSLILGVISHNLTDFSIFWIQTVLLFIICLSYSEIT